MSIIANCREKYMKKAYPMGTSYQRNEDIAEDEISPYWEGYLSKQNKEYIAGYDTGAEITDLFFDNMDVYFENVNEISVKGIRESLKDWLEMERNQIITSLIEGQDDGATHD